MVHLLFDHEQNSGVFAYIPKKKAPYDGGKSILLTINQEVNVEV